MDEGKVTSQKDAIVNLTSVLEFMKKCQDDDPIEIKKKYDQLFKEHQELKEKFNQYVKIIEAVFNENNTSKESTK